MARYDPRSTSRDRYAILRPLRRAARSATLELAGHEGLREPPGDQAVARVATGLLRAFGTEPGFLYIEAHLAQQAKRAADLLLCAPSVGLLVFEVKSHGIRGIEALQNGRIHVSYQGRLKAESVVAQAEATMYEIRQALQRRIRGNRLPFLDYLAAFPRIRREEWAGQGYDQCVDMTRILLAEDLEDPDSLRRRLTSRHRGISSFKDRGPMPDPQLIRDIRIAFGDSAALQDCFSRRRPLEPRTLGDRFDLLATEERVLSADQQRIARLSLRDGSYLIRGVAGSGKTIVLATNLARLLRDLDREQLDWITPTQRPRIAALCFNRALVDFLREKLRLAFAQYTGDALAEDRVEIRHFNGFLGDCCNRIEGLDYVPISGAYRDRATRAGRYLDQIRHLDEHCALEPHLYDVIYLDEAQDFHPDELRILLKLMRPKDGQRNLVIFYDDAQNIYGQPRPTWSELGIDVVGHSIVMRECYRNTREIVEFAFNVLVGSGIGTRRFADLADLERRGLVVASDGGYAVRFAERRGCAPIVKAFGSREQEVAWVAAEVRRLVVDERVRPEDILILFGTHATGALLEGALRLTIAEVRGISEPHLRDKDRFILREGYLTSTTLYQAKGYDAFVTFLVGADSLGLDAEGRARFYVAATRAKEVLYVTGLDGEDGEPSLLHEATASAGRRFPLLD